MTAVLIVDFPHQCNTRAVHFAETAQMLVLKRPNVARRELWYAKAEYAQMKLVLRQDILTVRSARTSREAVDDDTSSTQAEESVCLMGIEHLLTPACINEVRTCRARCIQAVLTEQARVRDASATSFDGWERIALASIAQTRRAKRRARRLGELHQESV
eukprot:scaffold8888_cov129-Skeletonema_menzelii.AAC.4